MDERHQSWAAAAGWCQIFCSVSTTLFRICKEEEGVDVVVQRDMMMCTTTTYKKMYVK